MKKNNDYLYIFLHIPKTAGSTFRYHIAKNIKSDQQLLLGRELLGLKKDKEYLTYTDYQVASKKYISKLTDVEKKKIIIIHGHSVCYGVHEYFNRPARYFAFFRDPSARAVSIYNHKTKLFFSEGKHLETKDPRKKEYLSKGEPPAFYDWLRKKYNPNMQYGFFTMLGFLRSLGYAGGGSFDKSLAKSILDKFYFIGITENYNKDSLYLYNKLGFNKFFKDKNVSQKYYSPSGDRLVEKELLKRNKLDIALYKKAKLYNNNFIKRNTQYETITRVMVIKRALLLPITETLYATKAFLSIKNKQFNS